ncbi:hypothetical protein EMIHUDRAFT_447136, partial [Emiliania huxleyi CCMP1516]|uniref:Ig-like domain-containing protein n=2 Tax=Emiliania huxleyi TaxID=2903 RepID=A0A0D3K4I5_EMIH1
MAGEALISSSQLEARGGAPLRFSWRAGSERPVGPCVTTAAIELSPTQILARDAGRGQNTLRLDSALLNNTLSCRMSHGIIHEAFSIRVYVCVVSLGIFLQRLTGGGPAAGESTPPRRRPAGGPRRRVWAERALALRVKKS